MTATPLIVFAHADEAECFAQAGVPHLVTGVGKLPHPRHDLVAVGLQIAEGGRAVGDMLAG